MISRELDRTGNRVDMHVSNDEVTTGSFRQQYNVSHVSKFT